MKLIALSLLVVSVAACSSLNASAMRTGAVVPGRAANCDVRFDNVDFQAASGKYQQVGMVTLSGTKDQPIAWEGETKQRLQPKACELGGTVVTLNAGMNQSAAGFGAGMIQFMVWRDKTAGDAASSSMPPSKSH